MTPIYPKLCAGTYGTLLADFRKNVTLSIDEMDEIIVNHNFTQDSLEETFRLLKLLKNYHWKKVESQVTSEKRIKEEG